MRFDKVIQLTMVLTLFGASTALAQRPATLESGKKSISFTLPGDGWAQSFGFWNMLSDNMNLGINVGLNVRSGSVDGTTTTKQTGFNVGPAIRYYTANLGPVVPFLYGSGDIGFTKESQPGDESLTALGLAGGLGAEWFPLDNIGISGYTGITLNHSWTSAQVAGSTRKGTTTRLGTVTSGLSINLYFGGRGTAVAAQQ